MAVGRRYFRSSRWFAALALSAYLPVAVLGYGLHSVLQCGHCEEVAAEQHDCCCCHHEADLSPRAAVVADSPNAASDCDSDCALCQFLAQAQTPVVLGVAPEGSAPIVPLPEFGRPLVLSIASEAPLARGPPSIS